MVGRVRAGRAALGPLCGVRPALRWRVVPRRLLRPSAARRTEFPSDLELGAACRALGHGHVLTAVGTEGDGAVGWQLAPTVAAAAAHQGRGHRATSGTLSLLDLFEFLVSVRAAHPLTVRVLEVLDHPLDHGLVVLTGIVISEPVPSTYTNDKKHDVPHQSRGFEDQGLALCPFPTPCGGLR
jgi:hypothetical protein